MRVLCTAVAGALSVAGVGIAGVGALREVAYWALVSCVVLAGYALCSVLYLAWCDVCAGLVVEFGEALETMSFEGEGACESAESGETGETGILESAGSLESAGRGRCVESVEVRSAGTESLGEGALKSVWGEMSGDAVRGAGTSAGTEVCGETGIEKGLGTGIVAMGETGNSGTGKTGISGISETGISGIEEPVLHGVSRELNREIESVGAAAGGESGGAADERGREGLGGAA